MKTVFTRTELLQKMRRDYLNGVRHWISEGDAKLAAYFASMLARTTLMLNPRLRVDSHD